MKLSSITLACVVCSCAASALACAGDKPVALKSKPAAVAAAKAAASPAALTPAGFTPIVSKKVGSGVDMAYQIDGTPAVGQPLTIRLSMSSPLDADVTFSADSALALQNPSQVLKAAAGQPGQHSITVVPQALGRYYLNVFSNAQGRSSAVSIAVQVGDAAPAKSKSANSNSAGAAQPNGSGERVKTIAVP
jgi:hypothetical protein